jgi:twitching motility protein PilT
LVTGPTGSGKSTTLAAMVDYANRTMKKHILTVEDPIEFVHQAKQSLINQREVGPHTKSFARALKSALREDPDIILVGEMRDLETISLALTAAETGHLVLGTLHTTSAPKTMDRIIDVFPAGDKDMVRAMLSESVQAVISQMLLKRLSGGRVAAHEIMVGTPAVRNLIRENKIPQIVSMLQTGHRFGMQTMKDCIQKLVNEGTVSDEELNRFKINFGEDEAAPKGDGGARAEASSRPATPQPAARPAPAAATPAQAQAPSPVTVEVAPSQRAAPPDGDRRKGLFRGRF